MSNLKTIIFKDNNNPPPKNYLGDKDGKILEWDGTKGAKSTRFNNSNSSNSEVIDFANMTDEEKMEVRKNLGLYYESAVTGEKFVKGTDEPVSSTLSGFTKVSSDTPAKENIISIGDPIMLMTVSKEDLNIQDTSDGYQIGLIGDDRCFIQVVFNNSQGNEPGIYFDKQTVSFYLPYLNGITYLGEFTGTSKIDEKYLPEIPDTSDCLKRGDERTHLYHPLKEGDIVLKEFYSYTPIIAPCDAMGQDNPIYINEDAIHITFNYDVCGSEDSTIYIYDGENILLYRIEVHVPVDENDQRSNTIYDANDNVIAVYGGAGNDFTIQPSEFTTGTMCITSSPNNLNANEIYGIKVYRRRADIVPYEMKDGQLISRRVEEGTGSESEIQNGEYLSFYNSYPEVPTIGDVFARDDTVYLDVPQITDEYYETSEIDVDSPINTYFSFNIETGNSSEDDAKLYTWDDNVNDGELTYVYTYLAMGQSKYGITNMENSRYFLICVPNAADITGYNDNIVPLHYGNFPNMIKFEGAYPYTFRLYTNSRTETNYYRIYPYFNNYKISPQSNGNETNVYSEAYIQNKPNIPPCYKVYGTISNNEFTPDVSETRTFYEVQNDFSEGAIISLVDYDGDSIDRIVYSAIDILKTSQGVVWNNVSF